MSSDSNAFRALTEPYRRELRVHCYRMLGSLTDAEDAVQETLLAAWQGIASFEARSSLRTWLYRIATNRCLNAIRSSARRPAIEWSVPGVVPPPPTHLGDLPWLEAIPDALVDDALVPDARYSQAQSISLAFITALQHLPPQQLAVAILRDVLGFSAAETAEMLNTTVDAANSALKRARASLDAIEKEHLRVASDAERAIVDRFVRAYEAADVNELVAMFTHDVAFIMPPIPYEYVGRSAARDLCTALFGHRRWRLVLSRANGNPAFGMYLRSGSPTLIGTGLLAVTVQPDGISAVSRFDPHQLAAFGLPATIDDE